MKLPDGDRALVEEKKLLGYLLSGSSPEGRHKAAFFTAFGFRSSDWEALSEAIRRHAVAHEIAGARETRHGMVYTVEGPLYTPSGREPLVRSVWVYEHTASAPRLVTAYPLRGGSRDP